MQNSKNARKVRLKSTASGQPARPCEWSECLYAGFECICEHVKIFECECVCVRK